LHAPHRERRPGRHADHLHRGRAGQAAGGAVVGDRASAFHGASAGLYLDLPAPKPRWAAVNYIQWQNRELLQAAHKSPDFRKAWSKFDNLTDQIDAHLYEVTEVIEAAH
jgi:hypothetical protein